MGTFWISRKGGILEKGGGMTPPPPPALPTMDVFHVFNILAANSSDSVQLFLFSQGVQHSWKSWKGGCFYKFSWKSWKFISFSLKSAGKTGFFLDTKVSLRVAI